MSYDKNLFVDNVYHLAKVREIRIGELEARCGVSAGYLARLRQGQKNVSPGAEFLLAVSKELATTVDALLTRDLTCPSEEEQLIQRYLTRLIEHTGKNKIMWEEDQKTVLLAGSEADASEIQTHPLLHPVIRDEKHTEVAYHSYFHPFLNDLVPVKAFKCLIKGPYVLSLVEVWNTGDHPDSPGEWNELELVMTPWESDTAIPLTHTDHEKPSSTDALMEQLYAAAEDSAAIPHLSDDARQFMLAFLESPDEK